MLQNIICMSLLVFMLASCNRYYPVTTTLYQKPPFARKDVTFINKERPSDPAWDFYEVRYRNVSTGRKGGIGHYSGGYLQLPVGEYELTVTDREFLTAKTVSDTREGTRYDYTFAESSTVTFPVTLKAEQVYSIKVLEEEFKAFVVVSRIAATPKIHSNGNFRLYIDNRENLPSFRITLCDPCLED